MFGIVDLEKKKPKKKEILRFPVMVFFVCDVTRKQGGTVGRSGEGCSMMGLAEFGTRG